MATGYDQGRNHNPYQQNGNDQNAREMHDINNHNGQQFDHNQDNNEYHLINDNQEFAGLSKSSRMGFIRKVYCIISVQLITTAIFVVLSTVSEGYRLFVLSNPLYFYLSFAVSLCSLLPLVCSPQLARNVPTNYLLLGVFTLAESYMVSVITTYYTATSVLMAAVLTAAVVVALTVYAFTTDTDFTYMGGMLSVGLLLLLVASVLGWFFSSRIYELMLCVAGTFLFGVYLIYDTQLIMGGEGKAASYSLDDYVIAAINVYLDIINIFIYILRIIGSKR